jgi:ATP-binding cassette subfamily F protein uup
MLELFLFPPSLQWTQVGKLSGGEKRRLFLLKVLMSAPNLLLLDEPSNDLDVMTLAVLEDYLESFPGAVIVVSHDRYFLDKVVQRILSFEPDGHIRQYEGNFQAWLEQTRHVQHADAQQADRKKATETLPVSSTGSGEKKLVKLRLKFDEKNDLATIDQQVADLEASMEKIKKSMEEAASDYVRLQALTAELEDAAARYETVMNRWLYLQDLVEQINQGSDFKR